MLEKNGMHNMTYVIAATVRPSADEDRFRR